MARGRAQQIAGSTSPIPHVHVKEGRAWGTRPSVTTGEGSTGRSSSHGREEKRSGSGLQHPFAWRDYVHGHNLEEVFWINDERPPRCRYAGV